MTLLQIPKTFESVHYCPIEGGSTKNVTNREGQRKTDRQRNYSPLWQVGCRFSQSSFCVIFILFLFIVQKGVYVHEGHIKKRLKYAQADNIKAKLEQVVAAREVYSSYDGERQESRVFNLSNSDFKPYSSWLILHYIS